MFRFTIRDVLWLTVVVAMGCVIAVQRQQASNMQKRITAELGQFTHINYVRLPLWEAAYCISSEHQIPVLLADEVDARTTVTAMFMGVPLRDALNGILPPLNLDYEVKQGAIVIRPRGGPARSTHKK